MTDISLLARAPRQVAAHPAPTRNDSVWAARANTDRDLYSDTWVASDGLGRALPTAVDCRARRSDRYVGIFYFLWHGSHGTGGPYDITRILAVDPEHPAWGPGGAFHWWGAPDAGYFRATDPWVIRRNLSMLEDAGVDVLLCDVTNGFTYPEEVRALCEVARAMRREGNRTPQIAFVTHSNGPQTVRKLYDEFYGKRLYPELWFRWHGKPLLLGDHEATFPDGSRLPAEIREFFTWRYSWAWEPGQDKWPWIDQYPQRFGWDADPHVPEEAPAAVASHPVLNIGRSYHDGHEPPLDRYRVASADGQGLYFAAQWNRLLQIDPQFAFITGWNEWVAQRFVVQAGQNIQFPGPPLKPGDSFFVDEYNAEFSRDIEPMKGGFGDNYYYQMVAAIRRFKGVRAPEPSSPPASIRIDGRFADWTDVRPEYRDTVGDTTHRNWPGWGSLHYINNTGRNDIVNAKVACDARYVYFYVKTRDTLTPHTDPNWMLLLIDADQNPATGWLGYDYVVNDPVISDTATTLRRMHDGKRARIRYQARGNEMELAIPRALIGQSGRSRVAFDFHWLDNIPFGADISRFSLDGDSAPNGRFNYRYLAAAPPRAFRRGTGKSGDRAKVSRREARKSERDREGTTPGPLLAACLPFGRFRPFALLCKNAGQQNGPARSSRPRRNLSRGCRISKGEVVACRLERE